jgi:hypothetical protein
MSQRMDDLLEQTALRTLDAAARFVPGAPGRVVVGKDIARGPWSHELETAPRPRVSALSCFQKSMNHHMVVCTEITWDSLEAEVGGTTYSLPLAPEFLLGHYLSARGSRRAAESWLWPLAGESDTSVMLVYGFEIVGAEATPFSAGVLEADEVLFGADVLDEQATEDSCACSAEQGSVHDVYVMPTRILVAVSLVCMRERQDFDPMGALVACRFYPLYEIVTNTDVDRMHARLSLRRPKLTHPMPGMSPVVNAALFTDANPGPNPTPVPTPPQWSSIFDYYLADAAGVKFRGVNAGARESRRNDGDRRANVETLLGGKVANVETTVTKLPYQGEFDNLHLAPRMLLPPREVVMAPVCEHDCLHTHWRWGDSFGNVESLGWGELTPHSVAGAPLVPRNQDVSIQVHEDGAGFSYAATVRAAPWAALQPIFHHGSAYALAVSSAILGLSTWESRGVAEWYQNLRYLGDKERVVMTHGATSLARLRKL